MVSITTKPLFLILICFFFFTISSTKFVYLIDIANPGARYPLFDIYDGANISKSLKGQLNSVGMRQQYLLGTYIRQDYIQKEQLLPKKFNPKTMEVFVSSVGRSINSALSRMYGFYPPGQGWKIPEEVGPQQLNPPFQTNTSWNLRQMDEQFALQNGFTPIPLTKLQNILNGLCPNQGILKTLRYQEIAQNITIFQAQFTTFIAKIKLVFNIPTRQLTIQNMADLYDTILCDLTLGKDIPQAFDASDMRVLKYISDYFNTFLYSGTYGQTLSTLILTEAKLRLQEATNQPLSPKRYTAYFPIEPSMMAAVGVLNLTSPQCLNQKFKNQTITSINCVDPPTFSSSLFIELYQDDSFQFKVKVKYNGQYVYLCEKKQYECSYNEFWGRIQKVISRENYSKNCYDK